MSISCCNSMDSHGPAKSGRPLRSGAMYDDLPNRQIKVGPCSPRHDFPNKTSIYRDFLWFSCGFFPLKAPLIYRKNWDFRHCYAWLEGSFWDAPSQYARRGWVETDVKTYEIWYHPTNIETFSCLSQWVIICDFMICLCIIITVSISWGHGQIYSNMSYTLEWWASIRSWLATSLDADVETISWHRVRQYGHGSVVS